MRLDSSASPGGPHPIPNPSCSAQLPLAFSLPCRDAPSRHTSPAGVGILASKWEPRVPRGGGGVEDGTVLSAESWGRQQARWGGREGGRKTAMMEKLEGASFQ